MQPHTLDGVEKRLKLLYCTLSQTPDDHPRMPLLLEGLGIYHAHRFTLRSEINDLNKAIEYTSMTMALTPDGDSALPRLLTNLGSLLMRRFERVRGVEDIEKGVEYASLALALIPDGHPDLLSVLINLGTAHSDRFKQINDLDDIDKSIEYRSRVLLLIPKGHPDMSARLGDLGTSYAHRYVHLGEQNDIEKALEYKTRALSLISSAHPDFPDRLADLGLCHMNRFMSLGEVEDIDLAIQYKYRALESTPDCHPDITTRLDQLAVSHNHRFDRLGKTSDLEKSIVYGSRALLLTPDGHPALPSRLVNLAGSHNYRYRCLNQLDDLEKSIQYQSRALELTPKGHPKLPGRLNNLGVAYSDLFEHLGDPKVLEKVIEYGTHALALTPDGHPYLSGLNANLGTSYKDLFNLLGDPANLKSGLECMSVAVLLTPDSHPSLPDRHYILALLHFDQYRQSGDSSSLEDALLSFRIASQSSAGSPRDKFRYATEWAKRATEESSLNCIEAHQTAINLIPHFIWLGATTDQRYEDLEQVRNLAGAAAFVAIASSEYKLALEWLEHTRCVVWNQSLMLRSPLDQLHSSYPALASCLQTVANQLHLAGSASRDSRSFISDSLTPEQIGQEHRRLAKEYDNLLCQTRRLPGFEDFLRPIKANSLVRAAQNGPVVVINCNQLGRCDAILILPDQDNVTHIPLLSFSREKARRAGSALGKLLRSKGLRERGCKPRQERGQENSFGDALATLWYDLVKPILEFLGYLNDNPQETLPHITWCPIGPLTFLPIHAAGDYNQPRSKIFDYVVSSYTPTLTALLNCKPSVLTSESRLLMVGLEFTPGHNPLPGTTEELACVKGHAQHIAKCSELVNHQATTSAVLNDMEQHEWVHLACHAHQSVEDPTKSGFFMHDGTLDLASINRRSFKKKGLAFLSACQTATGDENLPDEAIHLASGMLMAGYSSVIATMWSVVDQDAALVADRVYSQLMKDGKIGNGEAGKALHFATADLRTKVGEKAFERWVPYIHIGS